jgi:hypothetical protein
MELICPLLLCTFGIGASKAALRQRALTKVRTISRLGAPGEIKEGGSEDLNATLSLVFGADLLRPHFGLMRSGNAMLGEFLVAEFLSLNPRCEQEKCRRRICPGSTRIRS